jgi:SAM-dependent methyltransferase
MGEPSTAVFQQIYRENTWGYGSGHGSMPRMTKTYRAYLEGFIAANAITSVIDVGCGDWQSSRLIDWQGADYLGLDVVPELVERNQREFGAPGVRFEVSPTDLSDLPAADLLITKDVLQHVPNAKISELVAALPRFKYALLTNDIAGSEPNGEIEPGGWRAVDLRLPPFDVAGVVAYRFAIPAVTRRAPLLNPRRWKHFPEALKDVLLVDNVSRAG